MQHYIQQQEGTRAEGADEQGFRGCTGMQQCGRAKENREVQHNANSDHEIVSTLLRVPTDGHVLMAHRCAPAVAA
jgi:hypothetical protein